MVALRSGAVDPRRKEVVYRDLGLSFIPHPVTKNVSVLKNEDAVKRAIRNLILTNQGESFFDDLYGGNVTALLFENYGPVSELTMKRNIEEAVIAYEPRATVLGVEIISRPDNNRIKINIMFSINGNPIPSQLIFTVERVR